MPSLNTFVHFMQRLNHCIPIVPFPSESYRSRFYICVYVCKVGCFIITLFNVSLSIVWFTNNVMI